MKKPDKGQTEILSHGKVVRVVLNPGLKSSMSSIG